MESVRLFFKKLSTEVNWRRNSLGRERLIPGGRVNPGLLNDSFNFVHRGRWEGGSGWGTHVCTWLIHVNVWQKPLQYCNQPPIKINKLKKIKRRNQTNEKKKNVVHRKPDEPAHRSQDLSHPGWAHQVGGFPPWPPLVLFTHPCSVASVKSALIFFCPWKHLSSRVHP